MVLRWLTKLVVVLSVLGVLVLDSLAWVSARFGTQDAAERAGRAAVSAWERTSNIQTAYDAALAELGPSGGTIETTSFTAAPDGTVSLTLHREVSTVVLHRVPPLQHLTQLAATVVTQPAP
jgi:hypothetical protein